MSRYSNKLEKIILQGIDLTDYNLTSNIQNAYKVFRSEKPEDCKGWFQGLTSAISFPYMAHDIMKILGCSEKYALDGYFQGLADTFLKLANNAPRYIEGNVIACHRHDSSYNGNPRYRIVLDDGFEAFTGVDSSLGYSATNYQGKKVGLEIRLKRNYLTIVSITEVK